MNYAFNSISKRKSDALTTSDLYLHSDGVYRTYQETAPSYRSHASDAMDYYMANFFIKNQNLKTGITDENTK